MCSFTWRLYATSAGIRRGKTAAAAIPYATAAHSRQESAEPHGGHLALIRLSAQHAPVIQAHDALILRFEARAERHQERERESMKVWTWSSLLLLAVLALWCPVADAQSSCGSRTRRNWDSLSTQDKNTYKGAIAAAMDSGAYIKFVEMHTEMRSEMEAHQQCMFIYWHRLMLVVFENMLRGQGSQYACVTIPYWDWITAHNRMTNNQCRSMADCSAIIGELGGVPSGTRSRQLTINGIQTAGACVNAYPLDHFCESGSVRGNSCARCLTRGPWASTPLPGSASYASVRNQVFTGRNIGQFSPTLEQGVHNNVHAALDGAIATFTSPSDPVFWSHHAMIDALHVIFHKCRVGTTRLTFEQKASHPVAWTSCSRRSNGGPFNPADVITMRTGQGGRNPIQGSQDQLIGQYFQNVPNRFADLMDIRDLGTNSYSYELSGYLATMYTNCDGQQAPAPAPSTNNNQPAPTTTFRPTAAPTPAPTPRRGWRWPWWPWGRKLADQENNDDAELSAGKVRAADYNSPGQPDNAYAVPASTTASNSNADNSPVQQETSNSTDAAATLSSNPDAVDVVLVDKDCDESTKVVEQWYDEMTQQLGGQSQKSMDEIERISCVFQDECLGGVKDYSPEFKKTWGATSPRCKIIVDEIKAGKQTICIDDWRTAMGKKFGCPSRDNTPATEAPMTSNNSPKQSYSSGSVITATTTTNNAKQSDESDDSSDDKNDSVY